MLGVQDVIASQKARSDSYESRRSNVGLIRGVIDDAKAFFVSLVQNATARMAANTFRVTVENPVQPPKVQEVGGQVSVKETAALLAGFEAVRAEVAKLGVLSRDLEKLSKELKPVPADFSKLEKAIRAIDIPETVIPPHPDSVTVSNLSEIVSALEAAVKAIPAPEKVTIPAYPKSVQVSNLEPLGEKLDGLKEALGALVEKPEAVTDMKPVTEALAAVKDAVEAIRIPIPNFLSSWNHSLDMQAADAGKAYAYSTVGGSKAIHTITSVIGGKTYVKTFTYTSGDADNPDAESSWIAQ